MHASQRVLTGSDLENATEVLLRTWQGHLVVPQVAGTVASMDEQHSDFAEAAEENYPQVVLEVVEEVLQAAAAAAAQVWPNRCPMEVGYYSIGEQQEAL